MVKCQSSAVRRLLCLTCRNFIHFSLFLELKPEMQLEFKQLIVKPTLDMFFTVFDKLGMITQPMTTRETLTIYRQNCKSIVVDSQVMTLRWRWRDKKRCCMLATFGHVKTGVNVDHKPNLLSSLWFLLNNGGKQSSNMNNIALQHIQWQ